MQDVLKLGVKSMGNTESWEPPLEFPEFKLWWRKKRDHIIKPVFVKYNGDEHRSLEQIKQYGLYQATNILRGFKKEDLEVVEVLECLIAKGWVVVVQNKT
jgi:hypothetical protein